MVSISPEAHSKSYRNGGLYRNPGGFGRRAGAYTSLQMLSSLFDLLYIYIFRFTEAFRAHLDGFQLARGSSEILKEWGPLKESGGVRPQSWGLYELANAQFFV